MKSHLSGKRHTTAVDDGGFDANDDGIYEMRKRTEGTCSKVLTTDMLAFCQGSLTIRIQDLTPSNACPHLGKLAPGAGAISADVADLSTPQSKRHVASGAHAGGGAASDGGWAKVGLGGKKVRKRNAAAAAGGGGELSVNR